MKNDINQELLAQIKEAEGERATLSEATGERGAREATGEDEASGGRRRFRWCARL